ncbi:DsrE family protein [Flavobacteriaceae bacterium M23B6Z8]
MKKRIACFVYMVLISLVAMAQETKTAGPVIEGYGAVYPVQAPDFKTDSTAVFKVVFDVGRTFENKELPNPLIETAARFLNMHVQNGVPLKNLHVALVIHGSASADILSDKKYQQQFNQPNPNTELIKELAQNGVQIILCGQTAGYRSISKQDALPQVQWALSAMTALIQLQNNEYRLIKF